jgi:hypothetical protein
MGRFLNATIEALQDLPHYRQVEPPKQAIVVIRYPQQTDVDDRIRYNKFKAKLNLTRVKDSNHE